MNKQVNLVYTSKFNRAKAVLEAKHQKRILERLDAAIAKLEKDEPLSGGYHKHQLTNAKKQQEFHLAKDVLLVYTRESVVENGKELIRITITMKDITNHKGLKRTIRNSHEIIYFD